MFLPVVGPLALSERFGNPFLVFSALAIGKIADLQARKELVGFFVFVFFNRVVQNLEYIFIRSLQSERLL